MPRWQQATLITCGAVGVILGGFLLWINLDNGTLGNFRDTIRRT
jgi:hypothetical protein